MGSGSRGDAKLDGIAALLMDKRQMGGYTAEALDGFEVALSAGIEAELAKGQNVRLSVDYHPDHVLSAAANAAGLDVPMFGWPSKTAMDIEHAKGGSIYVKEGYGQPFRRLA